MDSSSRRRLLPYLALSASILALGFSPMFARWSIAPGPVFGFYRMGTAILILSPFFIGQRQRRTETHFEKRYLIFPILGGLANALDFSFWYLSVHYTNVANATLLNNIAPLWVALIAWIFFKENLNRSFWIGLVLALLGAGIVLGYDFIFHPTINLGNMIAVFSSLFYASYFLITQKARQYISTPDYVWMMTLFSGLSMLLFSLVTGLPLSGFPLETYLAILAAGVITQGVGFLSLGYALGSLPASLVAPIMIFQPVLTAFIAVPLLGENLYLGQWVGGFAVLAGIYLVTQGQEKSRQEKERREASLQMEAPGGKLDEAAPGISKAGE